MKAPLFWYQSKQNFLSKILKPIGQLIYFFGKKRFDKADPYKGQTPVICIGNVTAGGTGKTPTAIYLANKIKELQLKPVFVTKGYGGILKGPIIITDQHSFEDTGDEAQLLKCYAPTIIAKNRVDGVCFADQINNYDVVILDDALQNHPSLNGRNNKKRFTIMTVDRMRGFGNGALIPAGPLREPLIEAFNKVDCCIIIGAPEYALPKELSEHKIKTLHAYREPLIQGQDFVGQKVIAFAGIGNPNQFFNMLQNLGCEIIRKEAFGDHYKFPNQIIERLIKEAEANNAILVTTEKDMVRITPKYYPYLRPFLTHLKLSDEDENFLYHNLEKLLLKTEE